MKEQVYIIALSTEEFEYLKENAEMGKIGSQGIYREMNDDYMCDEIEKALKAYKKAYINENAEITMTVRTF